MRAHHRRGAVRWDIVKALAPGIVVGTLLGAQVVGALPGRLIAAFFAAFIGWSAWRMLRPGERTGKDGEPRVLPSAGGLAAVGGLIGALSAFLGAGGGFLTIPFLTGRNVRIQEAIASSAACGFPIALAGTVGYIVAGWNLHLPDHTFGYLYLPAIAVITPASVLMAPLGARAAHALSVNRMRTLFAFILFGLAAYMLARRHRHRLTRLQSSAHRAEIAHVQRDSCTAHDFSIRLLTGSSEAAPSIARPPGFAHRRRHKEGDSMMKSLVAGAALALALGSAVAQQKEVKIGVIFDLSGPLAAGGSVASNLGTKYAIDMVNERGGVEGYKISAHLCGCAEQGGCLDQRSRAPAEPGEGRPDHGRVLQRPVRADGAEGRTPPSASCG